MPLAAHRISSSSSKRSTLRRVLTGAATASLISLSPATLSAGSTSITIVAGEDCPLSISDARVERTPTGVIVVYTLQNDDDQHVRQLVLTAATVDWLGRVIGIRMSPLNERVPKHSSGEYRAAFDDLSLGDANRLLFGIQAVRWSGRRPEWRTALKLNAAAVVAAR